VANPLPRVEIKTREIERGFSRMLFGEGLIMGFTYIWDWKNNRIWPQLLEMIKELNTDILGHLGGPYCIVR
jgi:hypothetical protein